MSRNIFPASFSIYATYMGLVCQDCISERPSASVFRFVMNNYFQPNRSLPLVYCCVQCLVQYLNLLYLSSLLWNVYSFCKVLKGGPLPSIYSAVRSAVPVFKVLCELCQCVGWVQLCPINATPVNVDDSNYGQLFWGPRFFSIFCALLIWKLVQAMDGGKYSAHCRSCTFAG